MNQDIDPRIAPLIKELNNVGLKTMYSCEGGGTDGYTGHSIEAYVSLDRKCLTGVRFSRDGKKLSIYWRIP